MLVDVNVDVVDSRVEKYDGINAINKFIDAKIYVSLDVTQSITKKKSCYYAKHLNVDVFLEVNHLQKSCIVSLT